MEAPGTKMCKIYSTNHGSWMIDGKNAFLSAKSHKSLTIRLAMTNMRIGKENG